MLLWPVVAPWALTHIALLVYVSTQSVTHQLYRPCLWSWAALQQPSSLESGSVPWSALLSHWDLIRVRVIGPPGTALSWRGRNSERPISILWETYQYTQGGTGWVCMWDTRVRLRWAHIWRIWRIGCRKRMYHWLRKGETSVRWVWKQLMLCDPGGSKKTRICYLWTSLSWFIFKSNCPPLLWYVCIFPFIVSFPLCP